MRADPAYLHFVCPQPRPSGSFHAILSVYMPRVPTCPAILCNFLPFSLSSEPHENRSYKDHLAPQRPLTGIKGLPGDFWARKWDLQPAALPAS